jgi:hypothetical protein
MSKRAPRKTWNVTVAGKSVMVVARTAGHAARQAIKLALREEVIASTPLTDVNTGGWVDVQIDCKGAA